MHIGKQSEEGLCASITMVTQDGQSARSKSMTLGELQHFLKERRVRDIYEQLTWKSCEYFYARAGNLGWWHLASKEIGEAAPRLEDIVTFCGKSPQPTQYWCERLEALAMRMARPCRIKICSTCYWRWKRLERERASQPLAVPSS